MLPSLLWWARCLGAPLLLLASSALAVYALTALGRLVAHLAHMRAATRDIPGPRVEHIVRLIRARRSPRLISDLFHDVAREFTTIFKFWTGPTLNVILLRADDIECVMTDKRVTRKSKAYDFLGSLMGEGLLHLSGEPWRRRRRIVEPCFRPEVLRGFPAVFHDRALVLVEHLRPAALSGEVVDVGPLLGQAVTDMVCHTVMAADVDTRAMEQEGLSRALGNGFAIILYRVFNPWFMSDSLFRLSAFYKYYKQYMNLFDDFTMRLLAAKRRERQRLPAHTLTDKPTLGVPRRRSAFLDVMLDTTEAAPLSDAELMDEAKTLITAATGGSTDAVGFVLLCIALRQDVQDRIVQELSDVFGEDVHRVATVDDLRHLDYLERVIKETLRMFPSIPQFGRSISQDMTLPSGYTVRTGRQLWSSP
ncbi:cytochrome P450 4C1-like [Thrips palmi]|uniref:Cytochrome P450 4C1-like n=1 Tax=Thrips palmi TaxID=161013 RepID=A0A6P8YE58_THRPL|nr:cytochrome P450 4C1-like [Thrips palmi]